MTTMKDMALRHGELIAYRQIQRHIKKEVENFVAGEWCDFMRMNDNSFYVGGKLDSLVSMEVYDCVTRIIPQHYRFRSRGQ